MSDVPIYVVRVGFFEILFPLTKFRIFIHCVGRTEKFVCTLIERISVHLFCLYNFVKIVRHEGPLQQYPGYKREKNGA